MKTSERGAVTMDISSNLKRALPVGVVLLVLSSGPAQAAPVLIDSFTTSQGPVVGPVPPFTIPVTESDLTGSGILGGEREVEATPASTVQIGGGSATFTMEQGNPSDANLIWDGPISDGLGLGAGIDLTGNFTNDGFSFGLGISGLTTGTVAEELVLYDVYGNGATNTATFTAGAPVTSGVLDVFLGFGEFAPIGTTTATGAGTFAGVDFKAITHIELSIFDPTTSTYTLINSPNLATVTFQGPFEATSLAASVPVPATLPLFLSGIAGIGLFGWWRERAAEA